MALSVDLIRAPVSSTRTGSAGVSVYSTPSSIPPAELPDKDYPLPLSTGRVLYHYHTGTMTRLAQGSTTWCPSPWWKSIRSMRKARSEGRPDGQVTSRRGTLKARAKVTNGYNPGMIFMNFHFPEAAVNLLTIRCSIP